MKWLSTILSVFVFAAPVAVFAQLTGDYINSPPATGPFAYYTVGTSPGASRAFGNWVATNLTFGSSYLFNRADGFSLLALNDANGNAAAQSILVSATSAVLVSFDWNLQTTAPASGGLFGWTSDSGETYSDVSAATGSAAFLVGLDERFGFKISAEPKLNGAGFVNITKLTVTPVPEASTGPAAVGIFLSLAWLHRYRKRCRQNDTQMVSCK